ncbi:ABC transporter permease [Caldalkalibacillus thermarum]|uniref:ABC transporter permease n=1 Tax=Caldalkalibacillus thermarum TaxID=296745 RepID=UPI001666DC8C|nr:ABC transporter permease [Caldalkalibacillus thermarum]GGK19731.1 ABC transporter permease [Caldalkalibacillus thermarum]
MRGYWQLTLAQLKLFARNKTVIFWTTFFPLFLMVTLGLFLGGGGSTTIKAAWVDQDESAYSLLLEEHFRALDALRLEEWADVEEANMALEKGDLSFIIVVPPGYGRAVEHGGNPEPLQIYYDEVDQSLAELGFALIDQVLDQQNKELVHFEEIVTYEKQGVRAAELTYLDFLVPGIVALMILSSNMNGVAAQIASWRERHILRRFKIAGVSSATFIAAQITARMTLNGTQALLVLLVGIYVLGAKMNGSWLVLLFYIMLGTLVFMSIGFIIAGLSKTPEHAAPIAGFLSFPMFFLGGIFFPITNIPEFLQPLVYAIPISHLSDCLRQVMNLGYGIGDLWWSTLILTVWFMTSFAVSAWVFKWE